MYNTIVSFDLETTGLGVADNQIIELGAVKIDIDTWSKVDVFQTFIKRDRRVIGKDEFGPTYANVYEYNEQAKKISNIDENDLVNAPDLSIVLDRFTKFIQDCYVMGHNLQFDIGHLNEAYKRCRKKPPEFVGYDTLIFSRLWFPRLKKHTLQSLVETFGIDVEKAHRSYDDALAVMKIMEEVSKRLGKKPHEMLRFHMPKVWH